MRRETLDETPKEESKYKGYKPEKGKTPPWDPFNPEKRKKRITIREKKFLMMLSRTGDISQAFRSAYTVKPYPDKRLEAARVNSMGNQVLARLREKAPELAAAFTFDDVTPDFVRKELMALYKGDQSETHDKIRILELMGKIHGMFTEKRVVENKITEVVDAVYKETDDDFPDKDERMGRLEIEQKLGQA